MTSDHRRPPPAEAAERFPGYPPREELVWAGVELHVAQLLAETEAKLVTTRRDRLAWRAARRYGRAAALVTRGRRWRR